MEQKVWVESARYLSYCADIVSTDNVNIVMNPKYVNMAGLRREHTVVEIQRISKTDYPLDTRLCFSARTRVYASLYKERL
jgi:hypothetical protein